MSYDDYGWKPYVSAAKRRQQAEQKIAKLQKQGYMVAPIVVGRGAIAKTFWGKAWCRNLESYSDYSNRLPRGRTYLRDGSVADLKISEGEVTARVMGSSMYKVKIKVVPMVAEGWNALCKDCAGSIDTLVELLKGQFSKAVMERICQQRTGLFPAPNEIRLSCSCPDRATMCKHVAAVLYGIGARLDEQPELIFKLRAVGQQELIATAAQGKALTKQQPQSNRTLVSGDLSALFGLEMVSDELTQSDSKLPVTPKINRAATKNKETKETKKVAATKKADKKTAKKGTRKH